MKKFISKTISYSKTFLIVHGFYMPGSPGSSRDILPLFLSWYRNEGDHCNVKFQEASTLESSDR